MVCFFKAVNLEYALQQGGVILKAVDKKMKRPKSYQLRRGYAIFHDVLAALVAWYLAFALRFNFQIPDDFLAAALHSSLWVIPLQVMMFFQFGLYKGIWRFASLPDLNRIIKAALAAAVLVIVVKVFFQLAIPRSVHVLDPILLVMLMGGSRFAYRAWKDYHLYYGTAKQGSPVIVIGANDASVSLIQELARSEEWRVVGVLDNESHLHGRELLTTTVLGPVSKLAFYAEDAGADHIIIATNNQALKSQAIHLAGELSLNVLTIPSMADVISGKLLVSQIRRVEVEDLLGRDSVKLDDIGLSEWIDKKVVLITGAGGSIGSELCRQILKLQPSILLCFDLSELALYQLEQEFVSFAKTTKIVYLTGDVKNERRLKQILKQYQPTVVFHAAAYKHVPLMETANVAEALNNNVLGTHVLAKTCKAAGVQKFVLVSTDKAVNPTNVMGASKRLAEMVCQGLQEDGGTRFIIVRFGNVLGSSGSVIPKFREQIAKGGPVTVTHPEITRYFMSIPEAAQLVMQAGLMGAGGEIFVLDMGEPVKIVDLAKDMIRLSGLHHDDIKIEFTGLRPGEKLYEELLADDESTLPTHHEKLRIAVARSADMVWVQSLLKWLELSSNEDEAVLKQDLKMWVEEYSPDMQSVKREVTIANHLPTIH